MTDVTPVPQGTSTVVQVLKQNQMRDSVVETMQTPVKQLGGSGDNGLHCSSPIATLRHLQANLANFFENEPAAQGSDGHTSAPLHLIGNITGSTPTIIFHRCRFFLLNSCCAAEM